MIRINNWTNQRQSFWEFRSGSSVNPRSARYGGAIAVFTYVCATMEVHTQGTPEVHLLRGSKYLEYIPESKLKWRKMLV
jgi:hypothetical protein